LPIDNVDTDAIIPKQFMKSIRRSGFGPNLFDAWRYLDQAEPGKPASERRPNPAFVLNEPRYAGASILLAGQNFGCGSSREHAPWALEQFGFRVLIAPSFAEIFFNNCFKNGILPICLERSVVNELFVDVRQSERYVMRVDLVQQTIQCPDGRDIHFDVDPFRKHCLENGLDDIQLTLRHAEKIRCFETDRIHRMPWLNNTMGDGVHSSVNRIAYFDDTGFIVDSEFRDGASHHDG
jgi:3-isopropylmalate/(R)-2-methylmalate dehydratase small subunit